jgi:ribonuclease J
LVIDAEERTVADRRRLGFVGVISVALALDERGAVHAEPEVELIGIPPAAADGRSFAEIAEKAVRETLDSLPRPRRRDPDAVADAVRRAVRAAVAAEWGKKPLCLVHVLTV